MQVKVETTDGLERRMRVEIPEERVESQVGDRLKSMMQSAKLPGFRPGKVPLKVVEQRFGRQVRDEVVGELVQSSFYDAIVKEKLRPAGGPTIDPLESKRGEGVSYTAVFEIYPEVALGSVEELSITRPLCEVGDAEIDDMLETLRKQRKTWKEVDRAAADGDQVVLDYEGIIDGEAFDGGTATESHVELGAGRMLKALEDGLVGKKAGDEAALEMAFPEDYHAKHVAGKPVTFKVKIHRVEEAVLPEVDEDFAKGFGVSEGGVDAFRKEVRANMERELEDTLRARTKQGVMDALIEANPVEVPSALVEDEKMRIAEANRRQ
ncbi:MAG: trigger factor, partial [Gammaproteobacteria bacterium]